MDSGLITILTSAGVAGVFCFLFILGFIYPKSVVDDLREEREALKAQVAALQDRADTAVATAQGTRDVLIALQAGSMLSRGADAPVKGG